MTREFKFRAWNTEYKSLLSWDSIEALDNDNEICFVDSIKYPEGDIYVFMQYTGLKDKNGVEIYEGDIVKDSEEPFIVRFGECTFMDCRFQAWYLEHIPDNGFWKHEPIDLDDLPVFQVIGNIYEHPHLLKQQS